MSAPAAPKVRAITVERVGESIRARAWAEARTLKPIIAEPAPLASITSLSLIAPAPERMIRARTSSVPILSSEATMASVEPCTSALMTNGSSETFLSVILAIISASELPWAGAPAFSRFTRTR